MSRKEQASRLRLKIRERQQEISAILCRLQGSGPMMRGSVYVRTRRCGKPRCHCAREGGQRDRVLAVRHAGEVRVQTLETVETPGAEDAVVAWRLFRHDRRALTEVWLDLMRSVDQLGRLREVAPEGRG
jgi:hypothetical protein